MTDKEWLELCVEAFDAIQIAKKSRSFMKKRFGETYWGYAGNGSHLLAKSMARRLREYLAQEFPSW